jgi:hypothetical protein
MMISSKTDQPRHCRTLSAVGRSEPRRPSGARSTTIAGTRASAPIIPATPSIALPTMPATRIAAKAPPSESVGTRNAPATITSSETERLPQSRNVSRNPSTRKRSGTGSIPQLGVSVTRSLRRYEPDQVLRV